jgi:REP element-mobilizing transposase RayT
VIGVAENDRPKRKPLRLPEYDYRQNGVYYITICVENHRNLLRDVGAIINRPIAKPVLSAYGLIVDKHIGGIPYYYPEVLVDKYVIMPNHIHLLLQIHRSGGDGGRLIIAPTISKIVQQLKSAVTKEIDNSIWQKSFYDHIIRDDDDYLTRWKYIDDNPVKWAEDEYYRNQEEET